jgi:hypothetical protein
VNKLPIRECGAEVFIIDDDISGDSSDADGDGIKNFDEYVMGLNPCSVRSFNALDADLDFDIDGLLNGVDPYPRCNFEDPAGMSTDCI